MELINVSMKRRVWKRQVRSNDFLVIAVVLMVSAEAS